MAQMIKNLPAVEETWVWSQGWEDPPEKGISPGEGNGYPLQYSCLENSTDRGAWQATVHGVLKSQTQLSILLKKNFFFNLRKNSLNSVVLYIFQKFYTHDFM